MSIQGPFFVVDFGHGLSNPEFDALIRAQNVVGAIMKVSQGLDTYPAWFKKNWRRAAAAGGPRLGLSWFRAAYLFVTPGDGARQVDLALDQIDKAGGHGPGDMPLAMDIEGKAWHDDKELRRRVSMQCAERYHKRTGRMLTFYGNGDIGIGPDDGFDQHWTPHPKRLGDWPLDQFTLDQYAGLTGGDVKYYDLSSPAAKKHYPLRIPGWGSSHGTDMNVVLDEHGNALKDPARLPDRLLRNHRRVLAEAPLH